MIHSSDTQLSIYLRLLSGFKGNEKSKYKKKNDDDDDMKLNKFKLLTTLLASQEIYTGLTSLHHCEPK